MTHEISAKVGDKVVPVKGEILLVDLELASVKAQSHCQDINHIALLALLCQPETSLCTLSSDTLGCSRFP